MANEWVDGQVMDKLMDKFVNGEQMGGWTSDEQFDVQICRWQMDGWMDK